MPAHQAGHGLCGFTPSTLLHSLEIHNSSSKCPLPGVTPGIAQAVLSPAGPAVTHGWAAGPALAMCQGLPLCPDRVPISDEVIKQCCFGELTVQTF